MPIIFQVLAPSQVVKRRFFHPSTVVHSIDIFVVPEAISISHEVYGFFQTKLVYTDAHM